MKTDLEDLHGQVALEFEHFTPASSLFVKRLPAFFFPLLEKWDDSVKDFSPCGDLGFLPCWKCSLCSFDCLNSVILRGGRTAVEQRIALKRCCDVKGLVGSLLLSVDPKRDLSVGIYQPDIDLEIHRKILH